MVFDCRLYKLRFLIETFLQKSGCSFGGEIKKCPAYSEARTAIQNFKPFQKYQHFFSTLRGTFMTRHVTSYNVHVGCGIILKHFFRTTTKTVVVSLVTSHAIVLGSKLKMLSLIRGQGNHIGFLIATKRYNTSLRPSEGHLC